MIPKVIHYCWFGRGDLPSEALRCIDSWKRVLPEYEIVRWDEDSFDITCNRYVREAYEAKKYAFVSDYVRLYALYHHGGVYMDTDVEVLKSFDPYLHHRAFSGFENVYQVPTGVMACEQGFEGFGELLRDYDDRSFTKSDGTLDLTTNVKVITDHYVKRGLKRNNKLQVVDGLALYPNIVFCPYLHEIGSSVFNKETVAIHHKYGSWIPSEQWKEYKGTGTTAKTRLKKAIFSLLGKNAFDKLLLLKFNLVDRRRSE